MRKENADGIAHKCSVQYRKMVFIKITGCKLAGSIQEWA